MVFFVHRPSFYSPHKSRWKPLSHSIFKARVLHHYYTLPLCVKVMKVKWGCVIVLPLRQWRQLCYSGGSNRAKSTSVGNWASESTGRGCDVLMPCVLTTTGAFKKQLAANSKKGQPVSILASMEDTLGFASKTQGRYRRLNKSYIYNYGSMNYWWPSDCYCDLKDSIRVSLGACCTRRVYPKMLLTTSSMEQSFRRSKPAM